MKLNREQFDEIKRDNRETRDASRDTKAALKAVEAQQVAILDLLARLVDEIKDVNARISFQRRPKS